MSLPPLLQSLRLPVIASPMFIISTPDLVIAQCKAGIVGSFPALNARPAHVLEEWLIRIQAELGEHNAKHPDRPAAPFAVNQAGGHAGTISPFALIQEIRAWFDGPLALSGSIANGGAILAAQAMGADLAYIGSAFIATEEANAVADYKQMLVASGASDIIYTNAITGVHGNYLKPSLVRSGLDPENLPDPQAMNFAGAKAWKDVWGSGQGIGVVKDVVPAARLVDRLEAEYRAARARLGVAA